MDKSSACNRDGRIRKISHRLQLGIHTLVKVKKMHHAINASHLSLKDRDCDNSLSASVENLSTSVKENLVKCPNRSWVYFSLFLASGQKKTQGEKTQEFKNSRKKLKLKPKNQFSSMNGPKNINELTKKCQNSRFC